MAALVFALALTACSDSTLPTRPARTIVALELHPHGLINLPTDDSVTVVVIGRDERGRAFGLDAGDYTTRVSDADVADFVAPRLRSRGSAGESWFVVETPSGVRDSVLLAAYRPHGAFHITLQFAPDIPDTVKALLRWAASQWEQAIVGALEPVTLSSSGGDCAAAPDEPESPPQTGVETGVRIYVGQSGHYPAGTYVEATGGPCVQRSLPRPTTILGQIVLNRDKDFNMIPLGRQKYLALHEMGHVLGLVGVVQGIQPEWFDMNTGAYTAPMALEGWRRSGGSARFSLHVDNGSHWGTDPPLWDIMTGNGSGPGPVPPITMVSIGALMDLGYPAAWSGAQMFE